MYFSFLANFKGDVELGAVDSTLKLNKDTERNFSKHNPLPVRYVPSCVNPTEETTVERAKHVFQRVIRQTCNNKVGCFLTEVDGTTKLHHILFRGKGSHLKI